MTTLTQYRSQVIGVLAVMGLQTDLTAHEEELIEIGFQYEVGKHDCANQIESDRAYVDNNEASYGG